jgi:2-polyprenyl-3-methyl-5-hydroxy-6-metoxy-1,4-benzoquinol methylase
MSMKNTKSIFKTAITILLSKNGTNEVLSEAALPAYAHKNPLIDFIFWKRIEIAIQKVKSSKKTENILDFGCGTGVLSYELNKLGHTVTAIDLDLSPQITLSKQIDFPSNIKFIEGDIFKQEFDQKFDVIIALDVLEHIPLDILPKYLEHFKQLLTENGKMIISGPTENILYKIGRFMAGSDFTGSYHETNIALIKNEFKKIFTITKVRKLYFPLVLFEVFEALKK